MPVALYVPKGSMIAKSMNEKYGSDLEGIGEKVENQSCDSCLCVSMLYCALMQKTRFWEYTGMLSNMRVVWYRCRERKTGKMQECVCKCVGVQKRNAPKTPSLEKRNNREGSKRARMYKSVNVYRFIMSGPDRRHV